MSSKIMSEIIINNQSFQVPDEVAIKFSQMENKLKKVQDWVDKTDSLVNGCGIEDEYYQLSEIMYDEDQNK